MRFAAPASPWLMHMRCAQPVVEPQFHVRSDATHVEVEMAGLTLDILTLARPSIWNACYC